MLQEIFKENTNKHGSLRNLFVPSLWRQMNSKIHLRSSVDFAKSQTNQLAHKHVTFRTDKAVGIKHFVMSAVHKHNVLVLQLLTSVAPDS